MDREIAASFRFAFESVHWLLARIGTLSLQFFYAILFKFFLSLLQEDNSENTANYGVDDMIFVKEEEVFPTIKADDFPVEEEIKGTSDTVEANPNGKRKLPEKTAEKKVFPLYLSLSLYVPLDLVLASTWQL